MDCACDHKYQSLVKYGRAKLKDITRAWELIYGEYTDITGSIHVKTLINLSKELSWQQAKLNSVSICLVVLKNCILYRIPPNQQAIGVLRKYGYNQPFDLENPEEYFTSLDQVATMSGNTKMAMDIAASRYKVETDKMSRKPLTRVEFQNQIAMIGKHMGFPINTKVTTVFEFASYRHDYEAEVKRSKIKI